MPTVDTEMLDSLPFEFIGREDLSSTDQHRVSSTSAHIGSDALVEDFLFKRKSSAEKLLTAFEGLHDPQNSTNLRMMCASFVQVFHVSRETPYKQTATLLTGFHARKKACFNIFLPTAVTAVRPPRCVSQASPA